MKIRERIRSDGFTVIEIMMVISILGILSGIAIASYSRFIEKAKYISVVEDIRNIARNIDNFYIENEAYPSNLNQVGAEALRDVWGNPYQYSDFATTDKKDWRKDGNDKPINTFYDLWSNGKDGKTKKRVDSKEGRDDIIRAWDGNFIGYGKEFHEMQSGK